MTWGEVAQIGSALGIGAVVSAYIGTRLERRSTKIRGAIEAKRESYPKILIVVEECESIVQDVVRTLDKHWHWDDPRDQPWAELHNELHTARSRLADALTAHRLAVSDALHELLAEFEGRLWVVGLYVESLYAAFYELPGQEGRDELTPPHYTSDGQGSEESFNVWRQSLTGPVFDSGEWLHTARGSIQDVMRSELDVA